VRIPVEEEKSVSAL
jgi:hypothetical protein